MPSYHARHLLDSLTPVTLYAIRSTRDVVLPRKGRSPRDSMRVEVRTETDFRDRPLEIISSQIPSFPLARTPSLATLPPCLSGERPRPFIIPPNHNFPLECSVSYDPDLLRSTPSFELLLFGLTRARASGTLDSRGPRGLGLEPRSATMTCLRCQGLMVEGNFFDFGGDLWTRVLD